MPILKVKTADGWEVVSATASQPDNYEALPECSDVNNGQFLRVIDGQPVWSTVKNAEEVGF